MLTLTNSLMSIVGTLEILIFANIFIIISGCSENDSREKNTNSQNTIFDLEPIEMEVPDSFPTPFFPEDNIQDPLIAGLGKTLFSDPIISSNNTKSCQTCHLLEKAFSSKLILQKEFGRRNTPSILNSVYLKQLYWDGEFSSLEDQIKFPFQSESELNLPLEILTDRLLSHEGYIEAFFEAFGLKPSAELAIKAIAQYVRTLISADSKWDRYKRKEVDLTPIEKQGEALFFSEKAECFHCHGGSLFTNTDFHNVGLSVDVLDIGYERISGDPNDRGKYKSPSLRNIAVTEPYMHDGRFQSLEEVVDFYDSKVIDQDNLDPLMRNGQKLNLSKEEKESLVAFLKTLTDSAFQIVK